MVESVEQLLRKRESLGPGPQHHTKPGAVCKQVLRYTNKRVPGGPWPASIAELVSRVSETTCLKQKKERVPKKGVMEDA